MMSSAIIWIISHAATAGSAAIPVERPDASRHDVSVRLLNAHNAERIRVGQRPLAWNDQLAQRAQAWANYLAYYDLLEHSQGRDDEGENLWMGTRGAYTPEQMIDAFIEERQFMRPGRFPDVSVNGNWADVAHYAQMIWPETRMVGCAIGRGSNNDVLVCRYWPAGNVIGDSVG